MKQIDSHTYGKSPACIYLAFQLSEIGDAKLASRVGQSLTHFRELVRSLERANEAGNMTAHQVGAFGAHLRRSVTHYHDKFFPKSEIVANLVSNIMAGEVKSLLRRATQAKLKFKNLQRELSDVPGPAMGELVRQLRPKLDDFEDVITPETLLEKSLAKLERKGKISTLY